MHWLSTAGIEYGLDADAVEELCLRVALRRAQPLVPQNMDVAEKDIRGHMTAGVVRRIKKGEMLLVTDLFAFILGQVSPSREETFALGAMWLRVLASYAVDIPAYLLRELDARPQGIIPSPYMTTRDRKLLAGLTEDGEFVLGWRDAVERAPGGLLAGEFREMVDGSNIWEWPFAEEREGEWEELWRAEEKKMMRFQRKRMKRDRGCVVHRMPGSWVE